MALVALHNRDLLLLPRLLEGSISYIRNKHFHLTEHFTFVKDANKWGKYYCIFVSKSEECYTRDEMPATCQISPEEIRLDPDCNSRLNYAQSDFWAVSSKNSLWSLRSGENRGSVAPTKGDSALRSFHIPSFLFPSRKKHEKVPPKDFLKNAWKIGRSLPASKPIQAWLAPSPDYDERETRILELWGHLLLRSSWP